MAAEKVRPMSAILLVALFATIAAASVITLADAAVRGRNAFRLVRGDMTRINADRFVSVTFADYAESARMPALRPAGGALLTAARASHRRAVRSPASQQRAAA